MAARGGNKGKRTGRPKLVAVAPQRPLDDDRPTEIYDPEKPVELHTSREQVITGRTIAEMLNSRAHRLSRPLETLLDRARADLPEARVDTRASLVLRHEFEFDRRVGYQLRLQLFDAKGACVEVSAEVDADGRAVRRGSMISRLIEI